LLKPIRQHQLFDAIVEALQTSSTLLKAAVQQDNSLPDYHDKRVLVAEDNKVNQKVILAMLTRFQIKADLVENGQAVLDQLAQQAYDLVLMDCQMPVMDGYEATRHVRAQELSRDPANVIRLPIVALTAHAAIGEREKCLTAGMDDYLSKPIEKDKLATLLSRWLGESIQNPAVVHETNLQMSDRPAAWDEARVLEQLDGDKALLAEIVALFLNEIPAQLTALTGACQRNDLPALADIAHRIKGMAGHFCAESLINCATALEQAARHAHLCDFEAMTNDLIGTARPLVACLSQPDGRYHGE
jgi:CheY-like chemotaxis protein/HPt (histidine-containing phosphotransfer) domain-containing protein